MPSREYVRATLLKMAEEWLCNRVAEGIAGVPSERIDAAKEVEICIEKGLLVPPGMCDTPERLRAFIDAALRRGDQKVTDRSKADS